MLCITGMHVLSTKLIPVHLPNTANFKNIVIATKQRGITSIKRLYEKVLGNKSFHTCSYTIQIIVLKIAVRIKVETNQNSDDFCIRHHTLAVPFGRIITIWKYFFCEFFLKFFAKVVCDAENFSNSGKLSLVPYTKDFGRITHF